MIKFFKDTYSNLSTLSGNTNAICFATDRQVILLGGKEYGRDQVKVISTSGDILSTDLENTIYFVTGEQAVYQKTSDGSTVILSSVTDVVSALEDKISSAFVAGQIVVGTSAGITSSAFVPDTTSGDLTLSGATLSTTLVNAATLKTQIDDVKAAQATLSAGDGIDVTSASNDGITWTISAAVSNVSTNSIGFDSNGKLTDNLEIRKLSAATEGYAASYALFNTKGEEAVKLGATIDIVKDQFLSGAELVTGTVTTNSETNAQSYDSTGNDKFIKLVFAVNDDGTDEGTATKTVYVPVNDLVDVYTAGDGIDITSANVVSIKKDATAESFLSVSSAGISLTGVQDAIDSAISGLSSYTAGTDEFLTSVSVDANGQLTGTVAQPAASGVTFDSSSITSLTATTVQDAIAAVASSSLDYSSLSASSVGGSGKYITTISETDGIISAVAADLDAAAVAYTNADATGVTTVSGALDDIYDQLGDLDTLLSGLDYGPAGTVGVISSGTPYTIINTIEQSDGAISATTVDMTAANTYQAGVTEALSTGVTSANARVGITSGSQADANDQFSNIIADYLSFHTADGNLA